MLFAVPKKKEIRGRFLELRSKPKLNGKKFLNAKFGKNHAFKISPPKYGNTSICAYKEDNVDKKFKNRITFDHFQAVFCKNFVKSYRVCNIKRVENVIKDMVVTESWNNGSLVPIDDALSTEVLDNILYSNSGFLCHKMSKKIYVKNCDICTNAFSSREENSVFPIANLVEIRSRGKLIYPSLKLFDMVKQIHELFNSHVENKSNDVFEIILHELSKNKVKLTFPCDKHKINIVSELIYYYIFICMYFFGK